MYADVQACRVHVCAEWFCVGCVFRVSYACVCCVIMCIVCVYIVEGAYVHVCVCVCMHVYACIAGALNA